MYLVAHIDNSVTCQFKTPSSSRAAQADDGRAVLAAIAAMLNPYRAMGERLYAIIKASAPALSPRTWYGMPAYAKDGKVVCFFRDADKFKDRYMTLGSQRRSEHIATLSHNLFTKRAH